MSKADPTVKLILLGNGSVGKTSIIARFIEDGFAKVYKQTVGLDFFEKLITLRGDKRAKLQLWDIGGQSIGSQMLGKYIYGSDIIFLCYDVTDRQSFTDVEDWLGMVRTTFSPSNPEYEEKKKQPMIFLCGNKIDLDHLRKIPEEVHDKFVRQNKLHDGFFTSAQSGDNVTPVFYDAAGKSLGIKLSAFELEFHKKILSVTVAKDEERGNGDNDVAKQMEEEDLAQGGTFQDMLDRAAAEEKKGKKRCCLF
jgi:Ras-related protein Rab-28|eukprot:g7710.t1